MKAKSILLRTCAYSLASDMETGQLRVDAGTPDIWGTVRGSWWAWGWEITAGEFGPALAYGDARTQGQAWVRALAAAHRPGIEREARKAVAR